MRHPRWRVPFLHGGADSAGSCLSRNTPRPRVVDPIAFFRFPFYRFSPDPPFAPFPSLASNFGLCLGDDSIAYRKGRFCTRVTGNVPLANFIDEGKRAPGSYVVFHSAQGHDAAINDRDYADNESARERFIRRSRLTRLSPFYLQLRPRKSQIATGRPVSRAFCFRLRTGLRRVNFQASTLRGENKSSRPSGPCKAECCILRTPNGAASRVASWNSWRAFASA